MNTPKFQDWKLNVLTFEHVKWPCHHNNILLETNHCHVATMTIFIQELLKSG